LPPEVLLGEASDETAPACWEPLRDPLASVTAEAPREVWTPPRATFPAKAGADRKESDQAWGPAEQDGPESEFHGVRPEG